MPGCGKTRYILQQHNPERDLILTQTRANLKDIRTYVEKYIQMTDKKRIYKDYRTVASYIINSSDKKYDRVYIDEASLMHAGYVGYIAAMTNAKEIILLGDINQIQYIERSVIDSKWSSIALFCRPNMLISTTKRCPMDVCHLLSNYYMNIKTTNPTVRSIRPTVSDGSFYQLKSETLLLTYTQLEKNMLVDCLKDKSKGLIKVHTIHEAQGLTSKRVVLVRIITKKLDIYNSIPHAIVAISRHTHSFRYITIGEPDLITILTNRIKSINDDTITGYLKQTNKKNGLQLNINRVANTFNSNKDEQDKSIN